MAMDTPELTVLYLCSKQTNKRTPRSAKGPRIFRQHPQIATDYLRFGAFDWLLGICKMQNGKIILEDP
jgi:hypothetical protein